MLKDIIAVEARSNHQLYLTFEDGVNGIVNIAEIIEFTGVFAPLKEPDYFQQVQLNREVGTIFWPNDADLDPDVLYALVTGKSIPNYESNLMIPLT